MAGSSGSSAGTSRWPVITARTPAAIAARNGTSSHVVELARGSRSISGTSWCESTLVSPWPGKCLAQAATPAACRPRIERGGVPGDQLGLGAERADADDRVVGVAVDVGVGRVVERDAGGGQVAAEVAGDLLGSARRRRSRRGPGCRAGSCRARDSNRVTSPASSSIATMTSGRSARSWRGQRGDLGRRLDVAGEQRDAAEPFAEPAADPVGRGGADESRL